MKTGIGTEKLAMSPHDKAKLIKAMVASGIASAGIGALVSSIKARKSREKALDAFRSRNTIVVPINKEDFIKDVVKPEDQKAMVDGVVKSTPSVKSTDMSEGDISKAKKMILGRNRRFDFFKKSGDNSAKKNVKSQETRDEPVSEEKIDGRTVLRGQDGKFVSKTDPVAVQQPEKTAGIWNDITNPSKTLSRMKDAFLDKPVAYTAGAIGSLYVAAMIADYVNKKRREKSKERLDVAVDAYVSKLKDEESEKSASDNDGIPEWTGKAFGGAFLVPMAITALVTNKIIENRKREKQKKKEMSDSYPDDPIILYKTSEDKTINMSPEDFIAVLYVKSALIKSADSDGGEQLSINTANPIGFVADKVKQGLEAFGYNQGYKNPYSLDEASNTILNLLSREENNPYLHDMIQSVLDESGKEGDIIKNMIMARMSQDKNALGRFAGFADNPNNVNLLKQRLMSDNRLQNLVVNRMTGEHVGENFKKLKENAVNRYLQSKEGWGLNPDGILFKIVSWIANNLGLGNYFAKNKIKRIFEANRSAEEKSWVGDNFNPFDQRQIEYAKKHGWTDEQIRAEQDVYNRQNTASTASNTTQAGTQPSPQSSAKTPNQPATNSTPNSGKAMSWADLARYASPVVMPGAGHVVSHIIGSADKVNPLWNNLTNGSSQNTQTNSQPSVPAAPANTANPVPTPTANELKNIEDAVNQVGHDDWVGPEGKPTM